MSYLDFMSLVKNARYIMTDSGGLQEETTGLGVPCFTIRENTEHPITIEEGTNTLVGNLPEKIIEAFENLKSLVIPEGVSKEELAVIVQQYTFVPSINPFDDHMIHVMCHNEYMIDKYWKFKKMGNPLYIELLNNMGNHIKEHNEIIRDIQNARFQQQLYAQMLLKKATPQQILLGKSKPAETSNKDKKK